MRLHTGRGVWLVALDGVQDTLGLGNRAAQTRIFSQLAKRTPGQRTKVVTMQIIAALIVDSLGFAVVSAWLDASDSAYRLDKA